MIPRVTQESLRAMEPEHDTFVGIDSDGCVFDTMEPKQLGYFLPALIEKWHLEPIREQVKDLLAFLNIYSMTRGQNRFLFICRFFAMLPGMPGVAESGVDLPPTDSLFAYCRSGLPLGVETLRGEAERTGDKVLADVLDWTTSLSAAINKMPPVKPFANALAALEAMRGKSDMMVVSQTADANLINEWDLHKLDGYLRCICGQDLGTKAEHLRLATDGRFKKDRVILIGDAPGDAKAAQEAGVLFYPIIPGQEEHSWKRYVDEAYGRFLRGEYAGEYADSLFRDFLGALPVNPPENYPPIPAI